MVTNVAHYFRYYKFDNGMDVIASLKCGTRFMDIQEIYPHPDFVSFELDKIENYLTEDTIFVYRDATEHMLSGLVTDFALNSRRTTLTKLSTEYINGEGTHWKRDVYKNLYPIWNKIEFKFINLNDLSTLFENTPHDPVLYDHKRLIGIEKLTDITKSIPEPLLKELMEISKTENEWLGRMVRGENNVVVLSDYNEWEKWKDYQWKYKNFL